MATEREQRIALNEAAFRVANERMDAWEERHREGATEEYVCECADPDCTEMLWLTRQQYESVRSDSRRFVVVPGHEIPDAEHVVERGDSFAVVEKPASLRSLTERTDPRRA